MESVQVEISDGIATVTLNRPASFNAIDDELARGLADASESLAGDASVRCVVFTGAGRAFCGGGDLRKVQSLAEGTTVGAVFHDIAGTFHEAIETIREMPKAVIASLNGPAAGGGFSLALACDYRVISDATFMQLAYTSHGLSIDGGGTFTLPRLVGEANAMAIALMDERIDAERALRLGLVHEVVPASELADHTRRLAERFARMPTAAIGRTKRLFNRAFHSSLSEQLAAEQEGIAEAGNHPEGVEGMASFLQKRKPNYG